MKKLILRPTFAMLVLVLMLFAATNVEAEKGTAPETTPQASIEVGTEVTTKQVQEISVVGGGDSSSSTSSTSDASINTTSISNYKTRTPPVTTFPPYLPYWQHGGWGTIKAYFPNGPNSDDQVYERIFNPANSCDMNELKGVLQSLPYDGPLNAFGGILNSVGAVFGGPDNFHHGRGFEIANSLIRTRRPKRKPLLVFIDSNVDTKLLKQAGYAYVGKVALEGKVELNWDQVYDAAVAESLPWDVDILLISGGMKGVTVGSNSAFPGAGGAYSQTNYSISMFGSVSNGITEGKGKALVSAAGYRYWPAAVNRRKIPRAFYNKIHAKAQLIQNGQQAVQQPICAPPAKKPQPVTKKTTAAQQETLTPALKKPQPVKKEPGSVGTVTFPPAPQRRSRAGVYISQELYDMAGFKENQKIDYLIIK